MIAKAIFFASSDSLTPSGPGGGLPGGGAGNDGKYASDLVDNLHEWEHGQGTALVNLYSAEASEFSFAAQDRHETEKFKFGSVAWRPCRRPLLAKLLLYDRPRDGVTVKQALSDCTKDSSPGSITCTRTGATFGQVDLNPTTFSKSLEFNAKCTKPGDGTHLNSIISSLPPKDGDEGKWKKEFKRICGIENIRGLGDITICIEVNMT